MIKFEHTIFALPFAFLGAFLAARGLPDWTKTVWILLAMVGARSAAMAFNRVVDREIDALNPRTRDRALPQGIITTGFVCGFIFASIVLFIFSAWQLNRLSFYLAPVALTVILAYSYTKRVTSLSHLFLGLALAIAPIGGWVAVLGRLDLEPLILATAVVFWVGGFDIIYGCQDVDFDRKVGLFSIPVRVGLKKALNIAVLFHLFMILLLVCVFLLSGLSFLSWVGLLIVIVTLIYEHSLVKATDLSRVNAAFFTANGIVSVILFLFVGVDLCLLV